MSVYSGIVAFFQFMILLMPVVFPTIELSELAALQFLGTIVSAWAALFLGELKTRHLLFALLLYLCLAVPSVAVFNLAFVDVERLIAKTGFYVMPDLKSILRWGVLTGFSLQAGAFALVASGLWMKATRAPYLFRRAGTNRQEKDLLFELRQQMVRDDMTNFKYVTLQTACPGIVMEFRGEILAFLRFFLHEKTVVIFDLIILPEARTLPHSRMLPELLRKLAEQPGLEDAVYCAILPARDEDSIQRALLSGAGFEPRPLDREMARYIDSFRLPGFDDWQPFAGPYESWARPDRSRSPVGI